MKGLFKDVSFLLESQNPFKNRIFVAQVAPFHINFVKNVKFELTRIINPFPRPKNYLLLDQTEIMSLKIYLNI